MSADRLDELIVQTPRDPQSPAGGTAPDTTPQVTVERKGREAPTPPAGPHTSRDVNVSPPGRDLDQEPGRRTPETATKDGRTAPASLLDPLLWAIAALLFAIWITIPIVLFTTH